MNRNCLVEFIATYIT